PPLSLLFPYTTLFRSRRRLRALFRYCIVVLCVAHNRRRKRIHEFRARFQRFADRFRAARIVIAGVNPELIDGRRSVEDSEWIKQDRKSTRLNSSHGSI